ncbi:MAG: hypothetical protein JSW67_06695 [Candidatus Latescibacterota bacterium]|nr:MAG: hypothetical protein JSW67_06695 [Candidatus Latescibacterota bacterium]
MQASSGRKQILAVCYGNICRSPTAEALLQRELRSAAMDSRWVAASAGVGALTGHPAAPLALQVAAENEVDLEAHRARQLTPEMATASDIVIALDEYVEDRILDIAGDIAIELWPVADPFGGPEPLYRHAFREIETHVLRFLRELRARELTE